MAPPNEFPETVDPEAVGSAIEKCTAMQFLRSRYDLQPKSYTGCPALRHSLTASEMIFTDSTVV
jgi:hypothetical protein